MDILITGHKGFIGSYFYKTLSEIKPNWVEGCDIKDGDDCRDFFKQVDQQYDLVIHCAAIVGGREHIENEPLSVATDLAIDSDMFNWAVKTKQKKVVYFSSSAAYPNWMQNNDISVSLKESVLDFNGDTIGIPDMTYGWTKVTGELLAKYARDAGVKVYVFRPFSGYGNTQDLVYPFPAIMNRLQKREDPFVLWGNGKQVRDFIHIEDIYNAVMKVVREDLSQDVFNLCNGRPTSFIELVKVAGEIFNWQPKEIQLLTDKPTGVQYRVGDPTKLHRVYKPKITLEEGIQRFYESSNPI